MSEAQAFRASKRTAHDLTAFQHNILVILSEEPMYGLAIKRRLEDYYGSEVNHGRLYPNLDELVGRGLIVKSELDKRTNQYALTDDGTSVVIGQLKWVLTKIVANEKRAIEILGLIDEYR